MIENLRTKIKNSNKFDEYILDFLLNIAPQIDMTKMTIEEQLDFLGYIGMFSLLYNSPQLFMMTFDKCKNDNANFIQLLYDKCNTNVVSIKTLMGIGFGLLNNASNE